MAEQWIIRVEGKEYGPADIATLREWKVEGRVLPTNPARRDDQQTWKTAGEIPGLFRIEPPPVQVGVGERSQVTSQRSEIGEQRSGITEQHSEIGEEKPKSKPPSVNILTETFRIYFRGFFQFFGLTLLSIVPIVSTELTSRFIDTASAVNVDLRTMAAMLFGLCMFVLRIVLIPIYIAGIQILTAELFTGHRISFLGVLNGAVKYWPRVAAIALFVFIVFFLLMAFGVAIAVMVMAASSLLAIVVALALLSIQVWLFARFFVNVLFWQQFAVLENAGGVDSLRLSKEFARSGQDLSWYQRPLWRGALVVSIWTAFILALALIPNWPTVREYFFEFMRTQDPQIVLEKMRAALQQTHGTDWNALGLALLQHFLQPLLGIAFVVIYLDTKSES